MPRYLQSDLLPQALLARLEARSDLLSHRGRTLILLPDATRPLPFREVLSSLLPFLTRSASASSLEILIGLGLHREMNPDELEPIHAVADPLQIPVHQHHPEEAISLGKAGSIPVFLNRRLLAADRIIAVGTVEPHQYAGFSGGIKALSIGAAGRETISAMHGLPFLRDPNTTLGRLDDNPFQKALQAIASHITSELLGIQCVPAPDQPGALLDLFFGPLHQAFLDAVALARTHFFEECPTLLDWIHLPVPAPKATNFYQASRAATYAALVERPAIAVGAPIFLEAPCPEGIGDGAGEVACARAMDRGAATLLAELRDPDRQVETTGGQQRAYVLARTLARNPIALIGAPEIPTLTRFGIPRFTTLFAAQAHFQIDQRHRGRTLADIFHRIPLGPALP